MTDDSDGPDRSAMPCRHHEEWHARCEYCRSSGAPSRVIERGVVCSETRTRISQGNIDMEVHQPNGALYAYGLVGEVELQANVSDTAKATTRIQLDYDAAAEIHAALGQILAKAGYNLDDVPADDGAED